MPRIRPISAFFVAAVVAFVLSRGTVATAGVTGQGSGRDQVCDVAADSYLGLEDYPQAIKLHQHIIADHPDDALAHYHLGFAYGMIGRHDEELAEYRRAAQLGLREWDLYVNLGRVYLEGGNYPAATDALWTAVALGPNHPEAHFNLGLAYERRAMLPQAEQEMRAALRLDPDQPNTSNMLAVICAEQGNRAEARRIWLGLMQSRPNFAAARINLAMLDHGGDHLAVPIPAPARTTLASVQSRP
jgi:tetratricopeptide (TPR) repeat protein